jgi:predicted phage terminase large subunit-like protein
VESPALGSAADILIIDDPLSGGNAAYSPTKQERAWEAIMNVLFQRLTPEGRILMIATLWTESDPSIKAMIAWRASATPAAYVNLAALNEDGRASFRENIVTGEREFFEPYPVLWHEYRDQKFIESKRKEMRQEDFETQYMGNAVATGGLATDACWSYYDEAELHESVQYAALIVDTGIERGEFNDPTLSLALGYGQKGYYVMDAVSGKWSVAEMTEQVLRQMERVARRLGAMAPEAYPFHVPAILIEKAALGRPLHDELVSLLAPCDIVRLVSPMGVPKELRARAQSHHVLAGRVFLPRFADFVRELKRQWTAFPRAAHDEYVDVLSYGIQHHRNVHLLWSQLHLQFGRKVGEYSLPTYASWEGAEEFQARVQKELETGERDRLDTELHNLEQGRPAFGIY